MAERVSRERELLKKVVVNHDSPYGWELMEEIQNLLAQPEQAVAECTNSDTWNCKYCNKTESCGALKDSRNFAPPTREPFNPDWVNYRQGIADAKREPLSDKWLRDNIHLIHKDVSFIDLVRAIEKAHGIGVES